MKGQIIYSIFTAIGIGAAFLISRKLRHTHYNRLSARNKSLIFMGLVPGVIIGAKIPVIISYGFQYMMLITGKSIFGALIGAYIGINLVKYFTAMQGNYGDRFILPLCVALGFGKIGCFFNGCCGGRETDLFINLSWPFTMAVHPTQIYESLFQFMLAGLFYLFHKKNILQTRHFAFYILLYSIFRFFIEFIRTEPAVLSEYSVYQVMAVAAVAYFSVHLLNRINSEQKTRGIDEGIDIRSEPEIY